MALFSDKERSFVVMPAGMSSKKACAAVHKNFRDVSDKSIGGKEASSRAPTLVEFGESVQRSVKAEALKQWQRFSQ